MSDAATKEQVEAAAPVAEVPAAQEASAPAAEDVKVEETPAATAAEAPAAVEAAEEKPAAVTESSEAPQETQNGEVNVEKTNGHNQRAHKNNRKYDPSSQPVTDDPALIRNQVEFYFGNSNLPIDKYMWEQTGGPENKSVSLKTICNFSRMRRFQPYSAVVAALKESHFLEVSGEEGEETIKRKTAYVSVPDAQQKKVAQSVYIKGFGEEVKTTQFDIEAWLGNYGAVNHVKLRRNAEDNSFKGSIFAEFKSEELAKAFVALDPAPTWNGNELKIMMKREYLDEKTRMIQAGEMEPSKFHKSTFYEGKEKGSKERGRGGGGHRGGNRSGKNDSKDWGKKNGFNNRGGGRGGRGRGRGNRGGRGGRGRDDREKRGDRSEAAPRSNNNVTPPTIQSTEANGKRPREDDGGQGPPAKKVDVGPQAAAV
ncbi:hypothetical protein B0T16DRAFT_393870 [Cercophora newfieldiana]|uniref:La domain-containing protein n=1 Tax=Cercophora newfieldiana TaxID=92897 RepID=A0AA40CJW1_9PEZI|nr:hypothetical protein B0T16DRAFT_393870 [Cercophora newfieldiana]